MLLHHCDAFLHMSLLNKYLSDRREEKKAREGRPETHNPSSMQLNKYLSLTPTACKSGKADCKGGRTP